MMMARMQDASERERVGDWIEYWQQHPCEASAAEALEELSRGDASRYLQHLIRDAPACIESELLLVVQKDGSVQRLAGPDERRPGRLLQRCGRVARAVTVVPIQLWYAATSGSSDADEVAQTVELQPIGHAVLALIDHERREAEFFNPMGSGGVDDAAVQTLLRETLAAELRGYTFVPQQAFCPHQGPQRRSVDRGCLSWSLLYAVLRVEEPDVDRANLIDQILGARSRQDLRSLIDAFACWAWGNPGVRAEQAKARAAAAARSLGPTMRALRDSDYVPFLEDARWLELRDDVLRRYGEAVRAWNDGDDRMLRARYAEARTDYLAGLDALHASTQPLEELEGVQDRIRAEQALDESERLRRLEARLRELQAQRFRHPLQTSS
ncbi:Hypothetical protein UVM_LOCUS81 [uncultured virus]|nr:Hypothetical protein UVM_LOCUS81 [uncultured virus]